MLKIEILDNGNMLLSVPDPRDRKELLWGNRDHSDYQQWCELFEPFWTNGKYHPVNTNAHDFGLTDNDFVIVEEMNYNDDDSLDCIGGHWCFNDYMIRSPVDDLIVGLTVELTLWHTAKEPERRESLFAQACNDYRERADGKR